MLPDVGMLWATPRWVTFIVGKVTISGRNTARYVAGREVGIEI